MPRPAPTLGSRLASATIWLWSCLPFRLVQSIGAGIGWLLWRLPTRERRISRDNLARCYPERSAEWQRKQLRRSLIESGKTLAEGLWLWQTATARGLRCVREVRGRKHIERALRSGRGIIFATPHVGNWELAGMYCGHWTPVTVLFRPPRVAWLAAPMYSGRQRLGMQPVAADGQGVRALHRVLKHRGAIGILPDQAPRAADGVMAPFFGIDAVTMTLLSRLAERSGAEVLFTVMKRLPRGRGFRAHFWPAATAVADPDPVRAAAAVNREVERCISLAPHQYMWSYKRFRRRKR